MKNINHGIKLHFIENSNIPNSKFCNCHVTILALSIHPFCFSIYFKVIV